MSATEQEAVTIGLTELDNIITAATDAVTTADYWRTRRQDVIASWEAEYGEQLDNAQENEKTRRAAVLDALMALGVKTKNAGGWTATDVVKNDLKIVDEGRLAFSLFEAGRLDECKKIDLASVKRVAKVFNLDGVETVTTHSLRLAKGGE